MKGVKPLARTYSSLALMIFDLNWLAMGLTSCRHLALPDLQVCSGRFVRLSLSTLINRMPAQFQDCLLMSTRVLVQSDFSLILQISGLEILNGPTYQVHTAVFLHYYHCNSCYKYIIQVNLHSCHLLLGFPILFFCMNGLQSGVHNSTMPTAKWPYAVRHGLAC